MNTITPQRSLSEQFPRLAQNGGPDVRELERLRARAHRFAEEHVRPRALEIDRRAGEDPASFDWDLVRAGAEHGMLGLLIPRPAGGGGGMATETAVVMEELCAACPGIALIFGAHALGISPLLLGGPSQWDGVLAELVASEYDSEPQLMACAITEPEAGTDVEDPDLLRHARITSHARRVPGGFRLSGTKRFISNGSVARWITLLMPTDPRRPAESWTCFLLDTRSEGFAVSRVEHKMGQRACPAAELTFDDVFVPAERIVSREGDGAAATTIVLACSRPPVAAIATGIARGAYERVLAWLQEDPAATGLAERQHVQLALAGMEEEIHLARQLYMDAATELDHTALGDVMSHPGVRALGHVPASVRRRAPVRGWLASERARDATVAILHRSTSERAVTRSLALSSMAKARGGDVAMRVTGAALELVGLRAGQVRAELEKLWRDAKLTQIYEGTNQLNRLEVYRGLCHVETMNCLPPAAPHPLRRRRRGSHRGTRPCSSVCRRTQANEPRRRWRPIMTGTLAMSAITVAERAEIRAMARELAARELAPRAAALDAGDQDVLPECWRLLVELGLDRMLLEKQHGGAGLGAGELLAVIEELAVGDGGIAMCVLLCNAALATLTDDQLADVPAGARWALVPVASETELRTSDGQLDGSLACALGAHGADGLVILLDAPRPAAWAIPRDAPGLTVQRDTDQMGLRTAPAASIKMAGITGSLAAVEVNGSVATASVTGAPALLRAGTAAIAHGIARRAHRMALEYAHARRQGGVAIIEHDAVSDMLAAMAVRLACWPQIVIDPAEPALDEAQALAVKIAATDAAVGSTTDAVQVFGGTGYMVETGIEKLMRDAKYCQLFPEPNWVAQDELMRSQRAGRPA